MIGAYEQYIITADDPNSNLSMLMLVVEILRYNFKVNSHLLKSNSNANEFKSELKTKTIFCISINVFQKFKIYF